MTGSAAPSVRAITCPSCGGTLELRAAGFSTLIVCQYCGSELDLVDPQVRLVAEHAEAAGALTLSLGTVGVLDNVPWTVIGYLERSDGNSAWGEYLLFNPYYGYRWLIHQAAGWSLGTPLMTQPGPAYALSQEVDGEIFAKCFREATNTVDYVLGEFYWHVRKGDRAEGNGYVAGQRMLSCEITGDEYEWTLEEWISSRAVADAFGIEDTGQYPAQGLNPLPHQPNPYTGDATAMAAIAMVVFALAVIFLLSFAGNPPRSEATIMAGDDPASRQVVIEPFTITGASQPFVIETRGDPGDNSWLDVEYTLTNLDTDESRIANQPIQYYYGSDWKEDDRHGTLKLASVPPGTYSLGAEVLRAKDDPASYFAPDGTRKVEIAAGPGGIFWSNLFLLALALLGPVIWVGARAMVFEAVRRDDYDYGHDH